MTLPKLAKQLDDARRDVALFSRLQAAQNLERVLSAQHDAAKVIADYEAAEAAAAAHENIMAGITNISVADVSAEAGENLLRRRFKITYSRMASDFRTGLSAPKGYLVEGFAALPSPVMLYLQEKRPDQIPTAIMALALDNPRQAFDRYFVAMRRGHL